MSKVLVDRELLERIANKAAFLHDTRKDQDKLAEILAQPADAEGVEVVGVIDEADDGCFVELMNDRTFRLGENLVRQSDHLAALSAVTAERDRLREAAELLSRLRGLINCTPENDIDKIPVWISTKHPTIERIDALLAAMAAKEA